MAELAYHRLTAIMDVEVFDGHFLLAFGPVAGEHFHLRGKGAHEFARLIARAVLLFDGLTGLVSLQDGNRRRVGSHHLRNQMSFQCVARFDVVHGGYESI